MEKGMNIQQLSPEILRRDPFAAIPGLASTGVSDPLRYYSKPFVGKIFRSRIKMGLDLLGSDYERILEVGYGSGFLLPHLSTRAKSVFGLDLDADPEMVQSRLKGIMGVSPRLVRGSILSIPFEDGYFDCVVAFSILEHIKDYEKALGELHRVTAPGGTVLIGMPSVNKFMEYAFQAIGFKGIDDHHVTPPQKLLSAAGDTFLVQKRKTLPFDLPMKWGLYHVFLLRR